MINLSVETKITLYTLLHFLVDALCAVAIFTFLYNDNYDNCLLVFFLYNGLAFLTQPLVGLLIDKYPHPHLFLLLGVSSILIAFITKDIVILATILLGIGNSFFHISGGKYVTAHSRNNIIALGIFVSTGALGLCFGQYFFTEYVMYGFLAVMFLLTFIILLSKEELITTERFANKSSKGSIAFVLTLLLVVVFIRSFVGKITVLEFDTNKYIFLGIAIATTLGKMLGGFVAKYLGIFKTTMLSMVVSIVMLCLFTKDLPCILIGIFFFNFSMPITLHLANKTLKSYNGVAFGALAAVMFPGYLLGMLGYSDFAAKWIICICTIMSALMIHISSRSIQNELY